MAKKKKRPSNQRQTAVPATPTTSPGTGLVWGICGTGLLLLLTIPAATWVTVNGAEKTVFGLIGDASRQGDIGTTLALLAVLVTALLAMALPFVPLRLWMREGLATGLALLSGLTILLTVILTRSTRNILAFGSERQVPEGGLTFTYLLLFGILGATMAYLAKLDISVYRRSPQLVWFGVLVGVLVIFLGINYILIPGTIIPPPELLFRQLGR